MSGKTGIEENMSEGKTGGQAAHLAWHRKQTELAGADPDAFDAPEAAQWWYGMSDASREVWEAAAAAGAASAHERTAELLGEAGELRELLARAASLPSRWLRDAADSNQGAGYVNGLRDCARELRGVLPRDAAPRSNSEPAVATSGTEHLAAAITRLAIPDEDGAA